MRSKSDCMELWEVYILSSQHNGSHSTSVVGASLQHMCIHNHTQEGLRHLKQAGSVQGAGTRKVVMRHANISVVTDVLLPSTK